MVEVALTLPIFLALLFVTIDLGRAAYTYVIIGQVAQSSARSMSLPDDATTDCAVFSQGESRGNGYVITADPKSVSGDLDPVANPTYPTQGNVIASNTGDLYLWPAVATASPPDSSANCVGTVSRGHDARVTAQVTFQFVPWTPIAAQIIGSITIVANSSATTQY